MLFSAILFIIIVLLIVNMYSTRHKFTEYKPCGENKKQVKFDNNVKLFKYDYSPYVSRGHFNVQLNDNLENVVNEDGETYDYDYVVHGVSPSYNLNDTFSTFKFYDDEEYLNVDLNKEIKEKHEDYMIPIVYQKFREEGTVFIDELL